MSCEQVISALQAEKAKLEKGKEGIAVAYAIQNLANTCITGNPRITHTSRLTKPEETAMMDQVWKESKDAAEQYLEIKENSV